MKMKKKNMYQTSPKTSTSMLKEHKKYSNLKFHRLEKKRLLTKTQKNLIIIAFSNLIILTLHLNITSKPQPSNFIKKKSHASHMTFSFNKYDRILIYGVRSMMISFYHQAKTPNWFLV